MTEEQSQCLLSEILSTATMIGIELEIHKEDKSNTKMKLPKVDKERIEKYC
jgi:hypothetical protein